MAITELYVDPSIAGDSGAGSAADPYGDFQHCADQEAFDTTNGTRISVTVGDGTAEILAAALDLATNFFNLGGPSATAPFIIQGCKNESPLVAGDGDWTTQAGIGRIDCNNSKLFAVDQNDFITLRHLEIFNRAGAGYTYLMYLGDDCYIKECELHTHSGTLDMCRLGLRGSVRRCHFHNVLSSENCLRLGTGGMAEANYINLPANALTALKLTSSSGTAQRNIIRVAGGVKGIELNGSGSRALSNSIWSNASSGQGIWGVAPNAEILNNVVEGFTGGTGIEKTTGTIAEFGGNHCYNNGTNYNVIVLVITNYGDNEDLSGSSPFANAGSEDMTPQDVGNMKEGAWPPLIIAGDAALTAVMKMWKGALEPAEPAGGGGGLLVHPGTSGGARG